MVSKLYVFLLISAFYLTPNAAFSTEISPEVHWSNTHETLLARLPANPNIHFLTMHLVQEWQDYKTNENPNFDIDKLILAILYGTEKHKGQTRKDTAATPYIIHPLLVCNHLWEIGKVRNSNILISAILHDTLEDTSATEEEIQNYFGLRVVTTIKELTNDPTLSTNENKQRQIDHVSLMSQDARLVKLADRLANIIDLRCPPPAWNQEKTDQYFVWGQKLLDALRGTNFDLEVALQQEIDLHSMQIHTST